MPKLRKKVRTNEKKCQQMHKDMIRQAIPARLEPNLYIIVDTDQLQKQENNLENRLNHLERIQSRRNWRGSAQCRRKRG